MLAVIAKTWPLIATSLLYLAQAGLYIRDGSPGLALAFTGYVIANMGLIWVSV